MISVVIPTYNRAELLNRTLYHLQRQNPVDYEILLSIDDDPDQSDKTLQVVHQYISAGLNLKYFLTGQYKKKAGWSVETYPLNVGIRHAQGDIILLNSAEVMSVTDTLKQHQELLKDSPNTVGVSTVFGLTKEGQKNIESFDWRNKPSSIMYAYGHKPYTGKARMRPLHFQMSIRRELLHRMRGFDERYTGWYGGEANADVDFSNRLRKLGQHFVFAPHIVAIHQWHPKTPPPGRFNSNRGKKMTRENLNKSPIRNERIEWGAYPKNIG